MFATQLANPPTQTSNKKKNKNRKNAAFPDPEERGIPTVSKSVEVATSNDVTDVFVVVVVVEAGASCSRKWP